MQTIQITELRCKYCNSTDVVKAGTRRLKSGVKQLYKCNGCLRKFSNLNRNAKQTDPEVILKTLVLVCRGYSYEQASRFILRKYQKLISTSVISKWVKEYNPPYLKRMLHSQSPQKAHKNTRSGSAGGVALPNSSETKGGANSPSEPLIVKKFTPEQTVISHVFTHRDLDYNFQVHQPKLAEVPLPELKNYLLRLPQMIRHEDFETAARCSQIKTEPDIPVKQSQGTQASKDALKALQFAKTNFRRHDVVENFMLNCDCYTIATEVPVWLNVEEFNLTAKDRRDHKSEPVRLGSRNGFAGGVALPGTANFTGRANSPSEPFPIAGHIDLLQYKFNTLYILDFKPNAAKEQKRKVATQLNLYALALAKRANLSLEEIRCAWFDEEDFFSFRPFAGFTGWN
jgi:transposase-like protein